MSSVAILGHRSMLEGGKPFDIPDFKNESDCNLYENDRFMLRMEVCLIFLVVHIPITSQPANNLKNTDHI